MKTWSIFIAISALALAQTAPVETHEVKGVVVDHLTNRPLNHVLVQLVRISKGGGDASVVTADDGRFVFLHMPLGKYHLTAEKRGQTPQAFHGDANFSTAIVIDGKQKTDAIVFPMRTDAAIDGTVVDENGEPARNTQVMLFHETIVNGTAETVQESAVSTASSGQYHFGHLDSGRYYISVSAMPWYAQLNGNQGTESDVVYPLTFCGDTTDGTAARAILLAEGASATCQISLRTVPGIRVKLAPHTRIALFAPGPGGSRIPVSASYTATAGGTDTFVRRGSVGGRARNIQPIDSNEQPMELSNIPAGRYEVTLPTDQGGFGQTLQTVDLSNGSTLDPAPAPVGTLTGKIDYSGTRPKGELYIFLGDGRHRVSAEISADGTFRFENVQAGSYEVHQNGQGFLITSMTAQGGRLSNDKVEVPSGGAVQLAINAEAIGKLSALEGFAMHEGTGIPGAMILLLPQNLARIGRLSRRDQSDSDGSFSLPNIIPGRYILIAIDDGHNLAYRDESLIKPYLAGGLNITIPPTSDTPVQVPVQRRKP